MVFGYTEDGDGNEIYDAGSSTDSDWPISCHTDLILRALSYAGVSLPDKVMMEGKQFKKVMEGV